jgi:type II pantothenate kinase
LKAVIAGIDIGITTTKIAGLKNGAAHGFCTVAAGEPIASASGALGLFLTERRLKLQEVERLAVTGVGAGQLGGQLLGVPCVRVDEFQSTGRGGLRLAGLSEAIVVSMGTGTAIVRAAADGVRHLGGSGVGGGTIRGLGECLLHTSDVPLIIEAAAGGSLAHVDLQVGDLAAADIGLPREATASNFGKLGGRAGREDYALGILNLVFQTIGVLSAFAARKEGFRDIVLTGKLADAPQARQILAGFAGLHPVVYHFPEHAEYATALGAALAL